VLSLSSMCLCPQPLRCSVEAISFSAHVDYRQNEGFMKAVKPAIVVLVHGEQNQVGTLQPHTNMRASNSQPLRCQYTSTYRLRVCVSVAVRWRS
jgi:cleavage and polyadenylation specificity factor subunit 3